MVATQAIIPTLPKKDDFGKSIDFIQILNDFDPSTLAEKDLLTLAKRCDFSGVSFSYGEPVDYRLRMCKSILNLEIENLQRYSDEYRAILLVGYPAKEIKKKFENARKKLITAFGVKAAVFYVQHEYNNTTSEEIARQNKEYEASKSIPYTPSDDHVEDDFHFDDIRSIKIKMIRKNMKCGNGKPLPKRSFAKFLQTPVRHYEDVEKSKDEASDELLELLVMRCQANPYWLFDDTIDFGYLPEEEEEPKIFATPDIILKWIEEGKPLYTTYMDGIYVEEE